MEIKKDRSHSLLCTGCGKSLSMEKVYYSIGKNPAPFCRRCFEGPSEVEKLQEQINTLIQERDEARDKCKDFLSVGIEAWKRKAEAAERELKEANAEIERLQSAYSAANELIGQMAAQKMKDELLMRAEFILNKNLVENLSQTIQERDKAERELEARRQGRFYD